MVGLFRHSLWRKLPAGLIGVAWLALVLGGLKFLLDYQSGAGRPAVAPQIWPATSRIERDPARATLVLIAHPHCPCTRATMAELEHVMARAANRLRCVVVFSIPPGRPEAWGHSELWRTAARIPGVERLADRDGVEARRFGTITSGQALLYDREGRLVFSGGITPGRGHAGDNAGRDAIVAFALGEQRPAGLTAPPALPALPAATPAHRGAPPEEWLVPVSSTPVFGCALSCPHDSLTPGGDPCRK